MSQPLLSILIPTVVGREEGLYLLLNEIQRQLREMGDPMHTGGVGGRMPDGMVSWSANFVETIKYSDNKEITIGEKREILYKEADGLFSVQVDDDDMLADGAIEKIINIIKDTEGVFPVDCITYRERCIINGQYFSSNHHIKYDKWQDNFDGFHFTRSPFYKDVIRTEIAKKVPFPKIRWNEDEQWSYAIQPLLTSCHHIDEEIYIYQHNSKPEEFNERYGIK